MGGGTLLDHVKKCTPDDRTCLSYWLHACRLLKDVAAALNYMHNSGVMHRDLKSVNVMLTGDGGAKLVDFGLSKQKREWGSRVNTQGLGTYFMKAPEMLAENGGMYDLSAEIFAFGIIVVELLTGQCAEDVIEDTRTPKFGLNLEGVRSLLTAEQIRQPYLSAALVSGGKLLQS